MKKTKMRKKNRLKSVGSLSLAVGVLMIAPKVIDYISDRLSNAMPRKREEDDWGPIIIRREMPTEEDENG